MQDNRQHSAGKGDKYRPVDHQKYRDNYDRIFRKNKNETQDSESTIERKDRENETGRA